MNRITATRARLEQADELPGGIKLEGPKQLAPAPTGNEVLSPN